MDKIKTPTNRKSRSTAIIDEDDARILFYLSSLTCLRHFSTTKPPKKPLPIYLSALEKALKISRKSLLNHLTKLSSFGWLKVERSKKEGEYKSKVVIIEILGLNVASFLFESNILIEGDNHEVFINIPDRK